jgi:hypothetical protein
MSCGNNDVDGDITEPGNKTVSQRHLRLAFRTKPKEAGICLGKNFFPKRGKVRRYRTGKRELVVLSRKARLLLTIFR